MAYSSIFDTAENRKRKWDSSIYEISERVSSFFWDNAPHQYGLEAREGQQDMAFEILDAIRGSYHIAVEAGVGIGKSYAYLVPLLLYNQKTKLPVVIATSTIALQEQLMGDIERISPMIGVHPEVLLAKGQTHYICQMRATDYFATPEGQPLARLKQLIDEGCQDRRTFPTPIPSNVWDKINVVRYSRRICFGCPFSDRCQYATLRDNMKYTNGIILCNQDLLTAHLFRINRSQDGLMNEEVQMVVIDEAHNLEDRVRSATTERHGQRQLINAINASIKSVRGEDREYVLEEADSAIRAVRALFGSARGPSMRTKPQPRNPLGHYQKREPFRQSRWSKNGLDHMFDHSYNHFISGCSAVGSARDLGSRGRAFESPHSDQLRLLKKMQPLKPLLRQGFQPFQREKSSTSRDGDAKGHFRDVG